MLSSKSQFYTAIAAGFLAVCSFMPVFAQELSDRSGGAIQQTKASGHQFYSGPGVATANLTTPARVLKLPHVASSEKQIRINIQYLLVDDETRASLYQQLGHQSVRTQTQSIPDPGDETPLAVAGTQLESARKILTTSCVSTAVISSETKQRLLGLIAASPASSVSKAPSIILIDGQEGQMNEIVQRPFVVGLPTKVPENDSVESRETPTIQVLDEGTSMRVRAASRDGNRVHIASEIVYSSIVDFQTKPVFGLEKEGAIIQVPRHQVETATTAAEMEFGQVMMVDPYISREILVKVDRGVPMFGKIPYISRSFKNTATARVNSNWMVMIEPHRSK